MEAWWGSRPRLCRCRSRVPAWRPFPTGPFSGVFLSQNSSCRELERELKLTLVNKTSLAHGTKRFEASGLSYHGTQDLMLFVSHPEKRSLLPHGAGGSRLSSDLPQCRERVLRGWTSPDPVGRIRFSSGGNRALVKPFSTCGSRPSTTNLYLQKDLCYDL